MRVRVFPSAWVALSLSVLPAPVWAAIEPSNAPLSLTDKLNVARARIAGLEETLVSSFRDTSEAKKNMAKIRELTRLEREEAEIGHQRMAELEKTIGELEARRGSLNERISQRRALMRKSLIELDRALREAPAPEGPGAAREKLEGPRRQVLGAFVSRGLREVEELKVDLADADELESKIRDEQGQLAYLFQDLREQESVLELNRQLQADALLKRRPEQVAQLENYRKLKQSEAQVEGLIRSFNSRRELEKVMASERAAQLSARDGSFASLRGKLPLPADGRVISSFGRALDPRSGLHVFKKGIDISAGRSARVRAVSAGKVAFSGELPGYGRVAIVDHGDHYYTLCAHLGRLERQAGDAVAAGDPIGISAGDGSPVYFEIRARNIAVNPLQWVSDSR